MGELIDLAKRRQERDAASRRATEEVAALQHRLQENVSLGHLMTTLGYIRVHAGITEPQEQLDMLCQTLFGIDQQGVLDLYQQQGTPKKGLA